MSECKWCIDPNDDEPDNPDDLCDMHNAEYHGTTLAGIDAQRQAELWDQL